MPPPVDFNSDGVQGRQRGLRRPGRRLRDLDQDRWADEAALVDLGVVAVGAAAVGVTMATRRPTTADDGQPDDHRAA